MIRPISCPICKKPLTGLTPDAASFAPFCSARCRQIDFFRWSDGKYKIVEQIDPSLLPETEPDDLSQYDQ